VNVEVAGAGGECARGVSRTERQRVGQAAAENHAIGARTGVGGDDRFAKLAIGVAVAVSSVCCLGDNEVRRKTPERYQTASKQKTTSAARTSVAARKDALQGDAVVQRQRAAEGC